MIVGMEGSVGTRPESVVNRRGSREEPLRLGDAKTSLTFRGGGSARGLCWDRKKSMVSWFVGVGVAAAAPALCFYTISNRLLGTRGGADGCARELDGGGGGGGVYRSVG